MAQERSWTNALGVTREFGCSVGRALTRAAMNVGIEASSGAYIAKVDGHGWVNPDFVTAAVAVLTADKYVGCVGGEIVPIADTEIERAIKVARFSRLGVGGGIYTARLVTHDIDTVQCGVYRTDVLRAIGGFDLNLQFGEDEEVNHRVRATGHRIVFEPRMRFYYHVRPTFRSLFRQYRNYGRARVAVVRKHPSFLRAKHLFPALLVSALATSLVVGVLVSPIIPLVVTGGYALALAAGGLILSNSSGGSQATLGVSRVGRASPRLWRRDPPRTWFSTPSFEIGSGTQPKRSSCPGGSRQVAHREDQRPCGQEPECEPPPESAMPSPKIDDHRWTVKRSGPIRICATGDAMDDTSVRDEPDEHPSLRRPSTEIGILEVHEIAVIEPTQRPKIGASDPEATPRDHRDVGTARSC